MAQGELPFGCNPDAACTSFAAGAFHLHGFALDRAAELIAGVRQVTAVSPWRHMSTPGGQRMSAAMSNCGPLGWVSDRRGYRYEPNDPERGAPWPAMPPAFTEVAGAAAAAAGYVDFCPDACLLNRYRPGARMGLHQDCDECDLSHPIVSISLGLPVTFRFGSVRRGGPTQAILLAHGDVLVWGGPSRLCYHAVSPLKDGVHPLLGRCRVNLTLRVAGGGGCAGS